MGGGGWPQMHSVQLMCKRLKEALVVEWCKGVFNY